MSLVTWCSYVVVSEENVADVCRFFQEPSHVWNLTIVDMKPEDLLLERLKANLRQV